METLAPLHHGHQPRGSSVDHYCPSLRRSVSSKFLSPPVSLLSTSVRASSDSSWPNSQIAQNPVNQFFDSFPKIASYATLTAVSALFLNGFYRNALISKYIESSPVASVQESMVEEREMEELIGPARKPFHGYSVRYLKLKEKIPIVYDFTKIKPDDQAWLELKSHICSCSEELELVKIGFEEILEKDPYGNKSYHGRILEYLEMVDECKDILKDIKKKMDRCERENGNTKRFLSLFNELVDRVRVLQGSMLGALKFYQELGRE
ncbi:hypothetical protein QN277_024529 [Acacia crassicarpa]|uniref:Uncharacterized protein n=1 Tax=Acacia crassicarpa TaxID=499986 RepID=A0AAE1JCE8_9FABA|nr:hypothetical protein QN277_024529 [Acacia crassicarpa]